MKERMRLTRGVACIGALLATVALCQAAQVGKAVVVSVSGAADYSQGGAWSQLKQGQELGPGASIRTANDSAVVLFLDQNGPRVRLLENTQIAIEKLNFEKTGEDVVIETLLDVKSGRIVGVVRKLTGGSKYEVKTPNGVAGIRGTEYSIGADGTVYVVTGQVVVVYVKSDGSVVTQVVNKGEMFNPATQRVEPIPADRLAELQAELDKTKAVGPAAAGPEMEKPPVEFISPIIGGN